MADAGLGHRRNATPSRDEDAGRWAWAAKSRGESALMGASIVIEAIVEDLEAKMTLMKTLNDAVSEDVILATSTLRLDIAEIS